MGQFCPLLPSSPCRWTYWALEVSCCGGNSGVPIPSLVCVSLRLGGMVRLPFRGLFPWLCVSGPGLFPALALVGTVLCGSLSTASRCWAEGPSTG